MACQELAQIYGAQVSPIPPADSPIDPTRSQWLIDRKYCCQYGPDHIISCDPAVCAQEKQTVGQGSQAFTVQGIPLTIIQESGFLAWVNERGMQCINKLTGIVDPTPVTNGHPYQDPGKDKAFQPTYCVDECYNVTPNQTNCFTCIKNALEDNISVLQNICPAFYSNGQMIANADVLMQKSLQCHSCVANNSTNLISTSKNIDAKGNTVFIQTYNAGAFNNIWSCITGGGLSVGAIVGITIASFIVVIALFLGFWRLWVMYAKKKTV